MAKVPGKGQFSEVSMIVEEGIEVFHEIFKEAEEIHIHFHFAGNEKVEKGLRPIYNINVNVSHSDVEPKFTTEIWKEDEFPETVGGDPSTSVILSPGSTQGDPPPQN